MDNIVLERGMKVEKDWLSFSCETNELVIGGSFFLYKNIYKIIWELFSGRIKN